MTASDPSRIVVGELTVQRDITSHPLLGDAHVIERAGLPLTAMSAIDWDRPTRIPTVAEPRALPPGSGSALLNDIALRAQQAGVTALRYAGPYPTHALFRSLLRSFRTDATEDEFTAGVLDRAVRLARDELAIDFEPAPFARRHTSFGFVDTREGILERARVDGVLYDTDGTVGSLARLRHVPDGASAELGFGPELVWAQIAELYPTGDLARGPQPIPQMTSAAEQAIVGKAFPRELREQFADTVADFVAAPLAADAKQRVQERPVVWQDLGWRSATRLGEGFALHAALWTVVYPRDPERFVLDVSYHLAMIVQAALLEEIAGTLPRPESPP